jgi:hypothetical protein
LWIWNGFTKKKKRKKKPVVKIILAEGSFTGGLLVPLIASISAEQLFERVEVVSNGISN